MQIEPDSTEIKIHCVSAVQKPIKFHLHHLIKISCFGTDNDNDFPMRTQMEPLCQGEMASKLERFPGLRKIHFLSHSSFQLHPAIQSLFGFL